MTVFVTCQRCDAQAWEKELRQWRREASARANSADGSARRPIIRMRLNMALPEADDSERGGFAERPRRRLSVITNQEGLQ